ncbi:MAG: hypothetical protein EAZ95_15405 [Bacteroidetes bacterium]|nr:MAG: hypothetical protein EAZ95_15405 [Bacteroidota bacterium]
MKKNIWILLFILCPYFAEAQTKSLYLKNKYYGDEHIVKKGDKVSISTQRYEVLGRVKEITDTSLVLTDDTHTSFKSIISIRKKGLSLRKVLGASLKIIGGTMFAVGSLTSIVVFGSPVPENKWFALPLAAFAGLGYYVVVVGQKMRQRGGSLEIYLSDCELVVQIVK